MTTESLVLDLPDPAATRALGRALGGALAPGLVAALLGDLGAGKTALVKAAIASLGAVAEDDVISPTFVLAVEYPGRVETLHVDAYRLPDAAAFEALGFGPLSSCGRAVLVEWAERVEGALPDDRLEVQLEHLDAGRRATVRARGPLSRSGLLALRRALVTSPAS
jgi:tRNA threonylcarbamoyl adenosine modification protein YjeE